MHTYDSILGPVDSAFYYVESPETPMNIGAVVICEGKIDFHELIGWIDARLHLVPRYLQRVVQAPFALGQPTWVADPDFYIGNHVMRVPLAAPASDAHVRDVIGSLLSRPLDRSKPLWEVYQIDGVPDRTMLFFKVHHCMVDGLAAVELFTLMIDFTEHPRPVQRKPLYDPPKLPNPFQLITDSIQRDFFHRFEMLDKLGKETMRLAENIFEPKQRLKTLVALAHIINGNLRPIHKLPINGKNSGQQTLVWGEFPLDEIHQIRRKVGASVNDVMLSLMTEAVESYCEHIRHSEAPFLRILIPVNIREDAEKGEYGNRISVLPIDIPFGISDPLERLKAVTHFSTVMKESSLSLTMDMVLTIPSVMPAPLQPLIWGVAPVAFSILAHTWCTNVAASPVPLYILGHLVEHVYGYFPLNPTMGLACVVVSYNQKVTMTLVIDQGIIHNPSALQADLLEAYEHLKREAKLEKPIPTVPVVPTASVVPTAPTTSPELILPVVMRDSIAHPEPPVVPVMPIEAHVVAVTLPPVETPFPTQAENIAEMVTAADEAPTKSAMLVAETAALEVVAAVPALHHQNQVTNGKASAAVLSTLNTAAAPDVVSTPASTSVIEMEPEKTAAPKPPYKLFSEEWAKAFREIINQSHEYRQAGAAWTAGSLAFVMNSAPAQGFPIPAAVYLDLHKGECRNAYALSMNDAMQRAVFVIAGEYPAWMEVLSGRISPLVMLTTGRLQLKKGTLLKLLPHTRSATALVGCARRVPWS